MKQTYKNYKNKRNFFEGYFIKCCNADEQLAIIPAFEVSGNGDVCASMQILTKDCSIYKCFDTKNFDSCKTNFDVYIGDNEFNSQGVKLDFTTGTHTVKGSLSFGELSPLKPTKYAPTIMGPFSYLKFLECYHFVISTGHLVTGEITIDDKVYKFNNDIGYIEGDYGRNFPKEWFYAQGNCFENSNASFMLAIAKMDKPKMLGILGFIKDEKSGLELKLGSYYLTKVKSFVKTPKGHKITLHHKDYTIYVENFIESKEKLLAPKNGKLIKVISEATVGTVQLQVYKRDKLIFRDTTKNISSECTLNAKSLCL